MKCIHDVVVFSRYLEKDLSLEKMKKISIHLEKCGFCRNEYKRFQTVMAIMKSVQAIQTPKNYADVIHKELEQSKQ